MRALNYNHYVTFNVFFFFCIFSKKKSIAVKVFFIFSRTDVYNKIQIWCKRTSLEIISSVCANGICPFRSEDLCFHSFILYFIEMHNVNTAFFHDIYIIGKIKHFQHFQRTFMWLEYWIFSCAYHKQILEQLLKSILDSINF